MSEVIIAGFHRSGTSMVTQLLHSAGLFVGDDLLGARPSNPFGHFEDREVLKLHDSILRDNSYNWQVDEHLIPTVFPERWNAARQIVKNRRLQHQLWGFKDPRVCMFLGLWHHLMGDAKVLLVFRSAVDSVSSIARRHAEQMFQDEGPRHIHLKFWNDPDLALRMWIVHNEAVLRHAALHPDSVVAISFESIKQGFPLLDHLNSVWGLGLDQIPTNSVYDTSVTQTRNYPLSVRDPDVIDRAMEVWTQLRALERQTSFLETTSAAS